MTCAANALSGIKVYNAVRPQGLHGLFAEPNRIMSMYFSKIIKTGERQREFNFTKLSRNATTRFSVDVPDDKGNRIMFNMHLDAEGEWKTDTEDLPSWIHHVEGMLADAIREYDAALPRKRR